MFCKNDSVKQKKQVLSVKQTESYTQTNVIALTFSKFNEWFTCCLRGEDKMTALLREVKDLIVEC